MYFSGAAWHNSFRRNGYKLVVAHTNRSRRYNKNWTNTIVLIEILTHKAPPPANVGSVYGGAEIPYLGPAPIRAGSIPLLR